MPNLWEIDHPYYCNERNFYSNEPGDSYKTWASFIAEYRESDIDLNLVFRFDWKEGEDNGAGEFAGDCYYRNGILKIFWLRQRKGIFACSEISVCRADEAAVIAFLRPRWEHMQKLWEPLSTAIQEPPS
jgi:hypothetical protein